MADMGLIMSSRPRKVKVLRANKMLLECDSQSPMPVIFNRTEGAIRTLYFHTGIHKTGSTALQAYLADNQELLEEIDISYKFPSGADKKMGNGMYLYDQLHQRNIPDGQLDELLDYYFAGRTVAICSSEDFTRFKIGEWQQVAEAAQRLQVQVKIVAFIRDVAPYYYSMNGQLIKGGESYASFSEFCKRDQYFPVIDSFSCMLDIFGREVMSVIHYDSVIDCIDSAFMNAIGFSSHYFNTAPIKRMLNRSLTEYEQEVLSRVNKTSGQQYSIELSDLLTSQRPYLNVIKHFSQDVIKILNNRHSADLDWLNLNFFDGTAVVKISENSLTNTLTNALSAEDRQAIDRDVAYWCISKIQSAQNQSIAYVADRLRSIDWKNAGNPHIPNDFDPIGYLLCNLDVIKSGMPPYEHFINFGQYEVGRRWKWANQ